MAPNRASSAKRERERKREKTIMSFSLWSKLCTTKISQSLSERHDGHIRFLGKETSENLEIYIFTQANLPEKRLANRT